LLFGGCQIIVVVLVSLPSNKIFICYHMDKKSYSQSYLVQSIMQTFVLCCQLFVLLNYSIFPWIVVLPSSCFMKYWES
jgi:hypothetical protein